MQTIEPIERIIYSVSEQNPIIARKRTYARIHEKPLFDMHYALEMGIVLKGCTRRYYQKSQIRCSQGDVWFCGIWEPHGVRIVERPCACVVINMWPPMLANLFFPEAPWFHWLAPFAVPVGQRPRAPKHHRADVLRLARRIEQVIAEGGELCMLRLRMLIMDLLILLAQVDIHSFRQTAFSPEMYGRISPALDIAFRSHAFITNEEAAHACRMNRVQFIREFHRLMGVTFTKFALRHRVSGAAEQLVNANDPIKTIVRNWGFTDSGHFHRLFVQHYGTPPRKYRGQFRPGLRSDE